MFDTQPGPGLAIVATGEIVVEGRLVAIDRAGGVVLASGLGKPGFHRDLDVQDLVTGYGGGGHATVGAKGDAIIDANDCGSGGGISGKETLVPLRGGCASGAGVHGRAARSLIGH